MNKTKNNLPIILVSLSSILFVVAILLLVNNNIFKSSNSVDSNDTNSKDTKEVQKKQEKEVKDDNQKSVEPTSTPVATNDPVPTSKPVVTATPTATPRSTPTATPVPTPTEPKNEEVVIKFFQSSENEITNDKSLSEKAKEAFVNVVDFIFYDKEIKGYTFKELTTNAKLKIIAIALKIDNKIDSYFPDYKDKIKGTYTNIKDKLVEKYLELTDKLCEKVGADTCNQAKEDWETLKKNFSITGEYLKKLGITGTDKLKNWYENWRDK